MVLKVSSSAEFTELINSGKTVVVDFTATWCGPCQMIGPYFDELSKMEEFSNLAFVKVDVDELEDVSAKCGVRAMPTFQVYKAGLKQEELVGASKEKLLATVKKAAGL